MTECTQTNFDFPSCKSRKVCVDFSGGNITSNGGVLLLKQADAKLGLTRAAARLIPDGRRKSSVKHSAEQMLRQRVYAIGCGEEDLNDHDELRHDIALLTKRIRQTWPDVKIIFRGDSGFCRWKMLRWCESHGVEYIVGIGGNKRLKEFGSAPSIKPKVCCPRHRKNNGGRWAKPA